MERIRQVVAWVLAAASVVVVVSALDAFNSLADLVQSAPQATQLNTEMTAILLGAIWVTLLALVVKE